MLDRLVNSVVVANGKGGVGKTSITANLAAWYAAAGEQVVMVDLDPQANLATEFGIVDHDGGEKLARLVMNPGEEQAVLWPTGRDGLSYLPGGEYLYGLTQRFMASTDGSPVEIAARIGDAIKPLVSDAIVLFDTPPAAGSMLADVALLLGQWLVIPAKKDLNSRAGVGKLLARLLDLQELDGSMITPLGVVLFDMDVRASRVNADTRKDLAASLGDAFPVFDTTIRHADKAQHQAKESGMVATEFARLVDETDVVSFWEARRQGVAQMSFAANASALADDYLALAEEIDSRISRSRRVASS